MLYTYWEGPMPPVIQLCVESMKRHHGDQFTLMDEEFCKEHYPRVHQITEPYPRCRRSDLLRMNVLHDRGGTWTDADQIFFRPSDLDESLPLCGWGLADGQFRSCYFAACAGSPQMKMCIERSEAGLQYVQRTGESKQGKRYLATSQDPLTHAYQALGGERRQHWKYAYLNWSNIAGYLDERKQDRLHDYSDYWNVNNVCCHITNKGYAVFKNWNTERLMGSNTFLSFMFRRAMGVPKPARARRVIRFIDRLERTGLVGAEIGVFRGETSSVILQQRPDVTLHMVDPWRAPSPGTFYDKWKIQHGNEVKRINNWQYVFDTVKKHHARFGDRAQMYRMTSAAAAPKFEDASLDFVFIDAGHGYDDVKEDLDLWVRKVKPGGVIIGHDYAPNTFPGVVKAVDERFSNVESKGDVWAAYLTS